jgi:8-oxo-dGTP diphosphatase
MILEVGVKVFLKNLQGKYLLLKRSKPYEGNTMPKWDIPGGRIISGEPLFIALKREVKEETGLVLQDSLRILSAQDILRVEGRHTVRITYLGKAKGKIKLDYKEHTEAGWFTIAEIKKLYHDIYLDPVLKLLN